MSEEIGQALQIIRVGYDGIEIAMKVGSGALGEQNKVVDFLVSMLEREKAMGQTGMKKLLLKGGDLQVFQFASEDRKQVKKLAKQYGLLYAALPDLNRGDGRSEILFHAEAVPRVNMMIQRLKAGRIQGVDDYLNNGEEKELKKWLPFWSRQKNKEAEKEPEREERGADASEKKNAEKEDPVTAEVWKRHREAGKKAEENERSADREAFRKEEGEKPSPKR